MTKRSSVRFNAKITPVKPLNDEFTLCKCYVMALNKNRNLSYIGRDASDEALPTLYNIPVVGHLYIDEKGNTHMGGHDYVIADDGNGQLEFKSVCIPYGVVPSQDDVHYEDIVEPNGDIHTYLVADVILWTGRFPELMDAIYDEKTYFGQSMEINVVDYKPLEEDKNYTNILKYTYSALCLLGKSDDPDSNVEPCFPMARVDSYELSLQDEQFTQLMKKLKEDLSAVFSQTNRKEGEAKMTNEIRDAILDEFGVTLDELDFEITDDMTEETFRAKVDEYACKKKKKCEDESKGKNSEDGSASDEGSEPKEDEYSFTYREKAEALSNAMPNSDTVSYWVCDFDDKYAYVERCSYDRNTHDYTEERGRFEYTYDEAEKTATITGEFEEMIVRWLTKDEDAAINAMRGEYEALVAYKIQRETSDREHALDEVVEQFADLTGNEEFDAIVANKYSYESVEALQNACYIVRGKFGLIPKAHKPIEPTVPVGAPREPATLRDKLHEAYGKR